MQNVLNKTNAPKNITDKETDISKDDFLVSKTDTKGYITYFNRIFLKSSGYSENELMGANHNLIRHPHMPRIAFKLAWSLIKEKKEFFGFIKNLRADGGYYWVFAYISADLNSNNEIVSYTSFRRKINKNAITIITPLYEQLIQIEKQKGLDASKAALDDFLNKEKTEYCEFIINLQRGAK